MDKTTNDLGIQIAALEAKLSEHQELIELLVGELRTHNGCMLFSGPDKAAQYLSASKTIANLITQWTPSKLPTFSSSEEQEFDAIIDHFGNNVRPYSMGTEVIEGVTYTTWRDTDTGKIAVFRHDPVDGWQFSHEF